MPHLARQFESLSAISLDTTQPVHLAIGMFDGLHRGHQQVIASACEAAEADSGLFGALTFWPHPSRLFQPDDPARMILSPEIKRMKLAELGLDFIVEEPFNLKFASIEADGFLEYLKSTIPSLASVHAGENWRFGKGRAGDMEQLVEQGRRLGIAVEAVECLADSGVRVSSTRIRSLLAQGRLDEANALLGYDYFSIGTVRQGKRLGRTIGTPTLNLPFEGDLRPAYGVYVVSVSDVSLDHQYNGIANFGLRPTVGKASKPLLEVHLLEDCPFDYGHRLQVVWKKHLRLERAFPGVEELRKQIVDDIREAKRYFAGK